MLFALLFCPICYFPTFNDAGVYSLHVPSLLKQPVGSLEAGDGNPHSDWPRVDGFGSAQWLNLQ